MKITLNGFSGLANCKAVCGKIVLYSSREAFKKISCEINSSNVYGLIGEYGSGAWAFSECIGGRGESCDGEIYINGEKASVDIKIKNGQIANQNKLYITIKELYKSTCFIGEADIKDLLTVKKITAKIAIERALKISKLPYTVNEIKNMFFLTDGRFDRALRYTSAEIYRISIAIGFALGKEIFCYPWLNINQYMRTVDPRIMRILKKHNKIVLIPVSKLIMNYDIKILFDHIIDFQDEELKKEYYRIDERYND